MAMCRNLYVGLLLAAACGAQTREVCSEASGGAEESILGASWLQESYALGSRLVTDTAGASGEAGPLTEDIKAEDFSDLEIPIGRNVLLVLIAGLLLILAHEAYVGTGAKPLLADHQNSNTTLLQLTFLYNWFMPFVCASLLVPISLDFALAMGYGATASGIFLSAGCATSVAGTIAGKSFVSEQNWDQRYARKVYLVTAFISILGYLGVALVVQAATNWSIPTRRYTFWGIIISMGVIDFFAALPGIAWNSMWNMVTPQEHKTFWMIMTQCSRNFGFLFGPIAFAFISYSVRKGRDVSPISMMSWSILGMLFFTIISLANASLIFPTELKTVEVPQASDESGVTAQTEKDPNAECMPEDLPPASRERIVWHMVSYSIERPFSIAAIEVATIMLLEVSYGWSPEHCGFAFVVVASGSLLFNGLSCLCLARGCLTESSAFLGATVAGLLGVVLLFDWPASGAWTLLVADAIVYGGASAANGIGEGWGSRAAMPGTAFSNETYRVWNFSSVSISRFMAPIVARFLIDYGGRNIYAALQVILCALGTLTVYRTVSLVWAGTRQRRSKDNEGLAKTVSNSSSVAANKS